MKSSKLPPIGAISTPTKHSNISEYRIGVRETMRQLPGWLQPFMTFLTGKPMPNELPRLTPPPLINFILTMFFLLSIMSSNLVLLEHSFAWGVLVLPITWVICTGLLRKIQVVFAHHCVHRTFFRNNPKANELMLNILTTIALVQHGDEYRRDHFAHHSRSVFTTTKDADAALLFSLGFIPGTKKPFLWRRFFINLFSPRLHGIFLISRFRSNIIKRPLRWRLIAILWITAITVGLSALTTWWHIALVVWLPLFFLYNVSALIQFLTEHAWMITPESPHDLDAYAERCWGRFFGEPCPTSNATCLIAVYQWVRWATRMTFIHAPARFGCFVGDLPAHDWHHLCGLHKNDPATWPKAIYSRQSMIDTGYGFGMDRRELWGLCSMLNHVFSLLEAADDGRMSQEKIAA